jgi:hypothetical protein
LLDRPPRLSPNRPASLHESASPHPSSSGLSEIQLPEWVHELGWEIPPSPHPSLASSGSSAISLPGWWHELALGSDRATTESYSPSDRFTPSHHPSSLSSTDPFSWHSDESMSTPYLSASGGSLSSQYFSASDGLAPSRNSISEGSQSSPSPSLNEGPLENAKFLNKDMIKKTQDCCGRGNHWWRHRQYCRFTDQTP